MFGLKEPEQTPPLLGFVLDPVYPKNDDGDKEEDESFEDEADNEEEDEDEEEEQLASADSILPPVHSITARISIPVQAPTPFWSEA
uniref:Uncharacterized protein n=1 Tax=Tanacetum cinerariifolium TaxID=118510 RepID=A0A699VSW3_TANCI|nr:hypothetical protein [Tanacetum cinerariifolium]